MASVIIRSLGDSEHPECIIISSGQLVLSWHRINISSAVSSHPQLHNWLLIAPRHRSSSFIQTRALLRMWAGVGRCDYNIHINWDFPQAQDILTIKAAAMFGFCYRRIESDQIMIAGWHRYLASEASEIKHHWCLQPVWSIQKWQLSWQLETMLLWIWASIWTLICRISSKCKQTFPTNWNVV